RSLRIAGTELGTAGMSRHEFVGQIDRQRRVPHAPVAHPCGGNAGPATASPWTAVGVEATAKVAMPSMFESQHPTRAESSAKRVGLQHCPKGLPASALQVAAVGLGP